MEEQSEERQRLDSEFKGRLFVMDLRNLALTIAFLISYVVITININEKYWIWVNLIFVIMPALYVRGVFKLLIIVPLIYFHGLLFPYVALSIAMISLSIRKELAYDEPLRLNLFGSTGVSDVASGSKFYAEDVLGSICILIWIMYGY